MRSAAQNQAIRKSLNNATDFHTLLEVLPDKLQFDYDNLYLVHPRASFNFNSAKRLSRILPPLNISINAKRSYKERLFAAAFEADG